MAVLHQFGQASKPLGLQEVLDALGNAYPARTVRRWLSEMVAERVVGKVGHGRSTQYYALRRSTRVDVRTSICFGAERLNILEKVRRPMYERAPATYEDAWVESYQPNITRYIPLEKRVQLETANSKKWHFRMNFSLIKSIRKCHFLLFMDEP